jgi:predicted dithiol-disulfide oxidoreductase (DUF899 family)
MHAETDKSIDNLIDDLERELVEKKRRLADLKLSKTPEEVEDYALRGPGDRTVKLSELFGNHDELIVVHNMGKQCPYCTMWADGFNGVLHHLEDRAGFVVVSPDDPETQREFASSRNWKFKLFSAAGSSFIKDMGFESDKGEYWPGFSTFFKKEGSILRAAKDSFGPRDEYCSVWHLFDLLPRGAGVWQPKFKYE